MKPNEMEMLIEIEAVFDGIFRALSSKEKTTNHKMWVQLATIKGILFYLKHSRRKKNLKWLPIVF